jgi:transposase InsO family protein
VIPVAATAPAQNGKPRPLFNLEAVEAERRTKQRGGGALIPSVAPANAFDASQEGQARAAGLFQRLVAPIIFPERYAELHARFPRRRQLIEHVAKEGGVDRRTVERYLARWKSEQGQSGVAALARKVREDKGDSRALNRAAQELIVSAILPKPHSYGALSVRDVFRLYQDERAFRESHAGLPLTGSDREKYARYLDAEGRLLPSAQLPKASYQTFVRFVDSVPQPVKTMARKGEDAYRNSELLSHRDIASMLPMDYVVMDHRVLDLFCLAPERGGWRLMRPWLTAALDMRTRKFLAWVIVETPSSDSIAAVLRQVFAKFGLPKHLYWDNGRDFRAEWFEGSHARRRTADAIKGLPEKWCGVLESVGVRVTHAIAYNARAKLIEPNFGNIANFDKTLPEYCGHKPGTRPERFAVMLKEHGAWLAGECSKRPFRTIEEIAYLYSELLGKDLGEREKTGDGMQKFTPSGKGWMCPNEAFELLIKRVERRSISEDLLQVVFAKRRELVIRNGEATMTFGGRPYHYRLSADPMKLLALEGRRVELGYDALDLSQGAIYHEGLFLGLASCPALRKMGDSSFIQDEIDRRHARKQVKQAIASIHRAVPVPSPEDALARRRAVAPVRIDSERPERPALLAQPLMDAAAALKAEREFRFDQASAAVDVLRIPAETPADDRDAIFNFFGDENTGGCE